MPETIVTSPRQPSPILRKLIVLICCAGAIGGLGCATMLALDSGHSKKYAFHNTPILTDSIFAIGKPDAAMAAKIGNTNAIAFLGKQHTYLLLEGGTQLNDVARNMEGIPLTLGETRGQLFLKKKVLWGNVSLRHTPPKKTIPNELTINQLLANGFKADRNGAYTLSVPVKGVVFPPAKTDKTPPEILMNPRTVAFYNPPDSSPPPDFEKLITVPLAVVLDLALTPVYLIGFIVVIISLG